MLRACPIVEIHGINSGPPIVHDVQEVRQNARCAVPEEMQKVFWLEIHHGQIEGCHGVDDMMLPLSRTYPLAAVDPVDNKCSCLRRGTVLGSVFRYLSGGLKNQVEGWKLML